ncbi:hypothetical protein XI07_05195 [Bradyrhizobium sp. CCBAU 11445]|nr:hypothetical protein [Bradyrhizobium sp. CCBAU 11445]
MNESEERRAELIVAAGDASKLLQFVEEALSVVALAIDSLLPPEPLLPVGFVGNVGDRTLITDVRTNTIGIVAFVGDDDGARIESVEQGLGFTSWASPGVIMRRTRRPFASTRAWIFVVRPPRLRPTQ